MSDLDQLIEQGELVREEKKWDKSLTFFDRALLLAVNQNLPEKLINILGHKLIIYKHLYYETQKHLFLELFKELAQTGLNIADLEKISGQPKATMLTRIGDYHLLKKDYKKSVDFYQASLKELDSSKKGEYGEFLGHLGFGQALSGNEEGFQTFKKAYQLVIDSNDLRPFHKLVVLAGIKLREAKSFSENGKKDQARESLGEAEKLGRELAQTHKLPLRLEEAERLKKELGF